MNYYLSPDILCWYENHIKTIKFNQSSSVPMHCTHKFPGSPNIYMLDSLHSLLSVFWMVSSTTIQCRNPVLDLYVSLIVCPKGNIIVQCEVSSPSMFCQRFFFFLKFFYFVLMVSLPRLSYYTVWMCMYRKRKGHGNISPKCT